MNLADQIIEGGPWVGGQSVKTLMAAIVDFTEINALRDELIAARQLRELLGQIEVSALYTLGPTLQIRHTCPHWAAHIDRPLTLAELVQRAGEHTEVCR